MSGWIPFWLGGEWEGQQSAPGVEAAILRKVLGDTEIRNIIGDQMVMSEQPAAPTFPMIDFFLLVGDEDPEIPRKGETIRVTPWATTRDVVDTLAERLVAILNRQPLEIIGSRLASIRLLTVTTNDDTDAALFSKALDFRVMTYPA
jgi:hypothetical protein